MILKCSGELKKSRRDFKARVYTVRMKREVISDKEDVLARWQRRFNNLLDTEPVQEESFLSDFNDSNDNHNGEEYSSCLDEVRVTLSKLIILII